MLLRDVTTESKENMPKEKVEKKQLPSENEVAYRQNMISSFRKQITTTKIIENGREQLDFYQKKSWENTI